MANIFKQIGTEIVENWKAAGPIQKVKTIGCGIFGGLAGFAGDQISQSNNRKNRSILESKTLNQIAEEGPSLIDEGK